MTMMQDGDDYDDDDDNDDDECALWEDVCRQDICPRRFPRNVPNAPRKHTNQISLEMFTNFFLSMSFPPQTMFYRISHILSGKLAEADQNLIQPEEPAWAARKPEGLLTTDRVPQWDKDFQKNLCAQIFVTQKRREIM